MIFQGPHHYKYDIPGPPLDAELAALEEERKAQGIFQRLQPLLIIAILNSY